MTEKTYTGGCHCGDVRFEADIDLDAGTGKCNCSFCLKARNWSLSVKPEKFRQTKGQDAMSDYTWNTGQIHWVFCKRCGVRSWAHGDIPEIGGPFISIACTSLDLTPEQLAGLTVRYGNGRDNDWMHESADVFKKFL